MFIYSLILFITATIFTAAGMAIYKGKTGWIHAYHQTKVTDKAAYGKAMGKALLVIAAASLLSGITGLLDRLVVLSVIALIIGLCVGIGCLVSAQIKYNKGIF